MDQKKVKIQMIKDICSKIYEVLDEIDAVCEEQLGEVCQSKLDEYSEGIGLFCYVTEHENEMKSKYPAFTDNQLLSIIVAQWTQLPEDQKIQYCEESNGKKVKSKKLKMLSKMAKKTADILKRPMDRFQTCDNQSSSAEISSSEQTQKSASEVSQQKHESSELSINDQIQEKKSTKNLLPSSIIIEDPNLQNSQQQENVPQLETTQKKSEVIDPPKVALGENNEYIEQKIGTNIERIQTKPESRQISNQSAHPETPVKKGNNFKIQHAIEQIMIGQVPINSAHSDQVETNQKPQVD